MSGLPLPVFAGGIRESWDLHELKLLSWLRTNGVEENDDKTRIDYLLLSLASNSGPLIWFTGQPVELKPSFICCLNILKNKYANDLRKEMLRLSSQNNLQVRSFRDSEHKSEMVSDLINDLDLLFALASINDDTERRDHLLKCFRSFAGALKMMNRAGSYEGTVLAALSWESTVISKAQEALAQASRKRAQALSKVQDREARRTAPSFLTQDLQPNHHRTPLESDVYYKTHLPPSQSRNPSPNQDNSSEPCPIIQNQPKMPNPMTQDVSAGKKPLKFPQPPDNFSNDQTVTRPLPGGSTMIRADSDPEYMMESFVDPQFMSGAAQNRFAGTAHGINQGEFQQNIHPDEVENLVNDPPQPSGSKVPPQPPFKPIIYDPEKNPYPPPEQIAQEPPTNLPGNSNPIMLPRSNRMPDKFASQGVIPSEVRVSNWLNSPTNVHMSSGGRPIYSDNVVPIPFPTSQGPSKDPQPSSSMSNPYFRPPPGASSSSAVAVQIPSVTQSANFTRPLSNLDLPQAPGAGPGTVPNIPRKPSKLVKLRRKGSQTSSNVSSSDRQSFQSLNRIKSFVGSLKKSSSRGSHSYAESDSTADRGPNTPSTLDPSGGGSGFDSEGHGKLRPMQAQFKKLFRKHRHPENVRRQQRSMLVNRSLPDSEQPLKGKGRRIQLVPSRVAAESSERANPDPAILGMRPDDELFPTTDHNSHLENHPISYNTPWSNRE